MPPAPDAPGAAKAAVGSADPPGRTPFSVAPQAQRHAARLQLRQSLDQRIDGQV